MAEAFFIDYSESEGHEEDWKRILWLRLQSSHRWRDIRLKDGKWNSLANVQSIIALISQSVQVLLPRALSIPSPRSSP